MIQVQVTNEESLLEIANLLNSDAGNALEQVGKSLVSKIKQRISRGINTAGKNMVSKSDNKTGNYSKKYGKKRISRGLQVQRVDLQFDGTTMASFGIIERTANSITGGFDNDEAGTIAGYNEVMFGNAYVPSEQEIREAKDELSNLIIQNI